MNQRIALNREWKYSAHPENWMLSQRAAEGQMEDVRIPHSNVELPFQYVDETAYQFVSCYQRILKTSEEWRGKKVLLTFDGVAHLAKVYLDGREIFEHKGGYTAFTVDLSRELAYGMEHILAVEVDSRESLNIPPFGYVIDYLTYGGIYREVTLWIKEEVYIEDVFVTTSGSGTQEPRTMQASITLPELTEPEQNGQEDLWLECILEKDGDPLEEAVCLKAVSGEQTLKILTAKASDWSTQDPVLYDCIVRTRKGAKDGEILDEKRTRFGFRTCEFRKDGFYLNGKWMKLTGLNRHQSYPYVGYAMPKRMQQRDAEILKHELGLNAVRTSHYPQSQHFLDRCDELGLLVFTEIPGWQHIGNEEWKESACRQVEEMVLQYRNHPSIILWGVRINESQDDDELYHKTNQIAHELDPGRQTGGVRFLQKSSLLEDVYTYNDFSHIGSNKGIDPKDKVTSNPQAPYLVSEYNGHMFPTKSFDTEAHRLEHALRHARVIEGIFEQKEVAGGFGWCMFDYNTHKDFGSGDSICYHGVMDMFRNPKLAASVYASQSEERPVFVLSSSLDIGEYPGGNLADVYAFTNADSVKVFKDETVIREFFPDRRAFPHMIHPPVKIDDFVGNLLEEKEGFDHRTAEALKDILFAVKKYGQNALPLKYQLKMGWLMLTKNLKVSDGVSLYYKYIGSWGGEAPTFRFEAVKDQQTMAERKIRPGRTASLKVITENTVLKEEDTYDVELVRIRAVDAFGNHLAFCQEAVSFETEGCIRLIGPAVTTLRGGMCGTYVQTTGEKGSGTLRIKSEYLGEEVIHFEVL